MSDIERLGTYSYSIAGTNTLTQLTSDPTTLYHVSVSQFGGSMGYLQIYNNGTQQAGAGTPDFTIPLSSGTSGAGTPSSRDINYGPYGRRMNGGISYLWSAGPTGTVVHGVNAIVDFTYSGTI